jgi:hypothetical protein
MSLMMIMAAALFNDLFYIMYVSVTREIGRKGSSSSAAQGGENEQLFE